MFPAKIVLYTFLDEHIREVPQFNAPINGNWVV